MKGWCSICDAMFDFPHHGRETPRWVLPPTGRIDTATLRRAFDSGKLSEMSGFDWFMDADAQRDHEASTQANAGENRE